MHMRFCLAFENSGDVLPFESINTDLLIYYVDNLNELGINSFFIQEPFASNVSNYVENLDALIKKFNTLPIKQIIDTDLQQRECIGYIDQAFLGQLHADWVKFQKHSYCIAEQRIKYNYSDIVEKIHNMYPDDIPVARVGSILQKLDLKKEFDKINILIHDIEGSFKFIRAEADTPEWIEIPNIFDKSMTNNHIANLSIDFNHLGRTLYNKFQNFDLNFDYNDENTYDQLLKNVSLKFRPPETINFSAEYVNCCQRSGRLPTGDFLNIGNLVDVTNKLTDYMQIVYKNAKAKNKFSFELTKE